MRLFPHGVLIALMLVFNAHAGSLVASSADAGVEGSRGSSNSIKLSSTSLADDNTATVQDGTYRVAQVDKLSDGQALLLMLDPEDASRGGQAFQLQVPRQAFDQEPPRVGELVQAQRRNYGVQFARGNRNEFEPFFMVVVDAVLPELNARPLTP